MTDDTNGDLGNNKVQRFEKIPYQRTTAIILIMMLARCSSLKHAPGLRIGTLSTFRLLHSKDDKNDDIWDKKRVNAFVGHNFPDFIEGWNRDTFKQVGYGLTGFTGLLGLGGVALDIGMLVPAALLGGLTAGYWAVGLADIRQNSHAVRRNFPLLGNFRYIMETIRPEIYQYIGKWTASLGSTTSVALWTIKGGGNPV